MNKSNKDLSEINVSTPGGRCQFMRVLRGYKVAEVAKEINRSSSTVYKIENGIIKNSGLYIELSMLYGCSVTWIKTGVPFHFDVPIISFEEAGKTIFRSTDIKNPEGCTYVQSPHHHKTGLYAIALILGGEAMESSIGHHSFREGDILFFNPDMEPEVGHYVLARQEKKSSAIFRKLVRESSGLVLKASNPQYPIIPLTKKIALIAVLVDRVTVLV